MNKEEASHVMEISGRKNVLRRQLLGVLAIIAFLLLPFTYALYDTSADDWIYILIFGSTLVVVIFAVIILIMQLLLVPTSATLLRERKELSIHYHFLKSKTLQLKDIRYYTTTVSDKKGGIFIYTSGRGRYLLSDRYVEDHRPVTIFIGVAGIRYEGDEEYDETKFLKTINNWLRRILPNDDDD